MFLRVHFIKEEAPEDDFLSYSFERPSIILKGVLKYKLDKANNELHYIQSYKTKGAENVITPNVDRVEEIEFDAGE